MLKIALVLACIPALITAKFYPCNSQVPGPTEIFINFCDQNDICAATSEVLGQTVQVEFDFVAGASTRSLTPNIIGPWWVLQKSTESHLIGCNSLFTTDGKPGCPIKAGSFNTYKMDLIIQELNQPIRDLMVDVQIELEGDGGKLVCFKIKAISMFKV